MSDDPVSKGEGGERLGGVGDVHVLVPEGIDDPRRPSGGNVYGRRVCDELVGLGWTVHEHHVAGSWPRPAPADQVALARLLDALPDRATVLVDGLVASAAESLATEGDRLRLVVMLHMPLAEAIPGPQVAAVERAALGAAGAVVTTSWWARQWVLTHHRLAADRLHVAEPGVDPGPLVQGSPGGGALLCVSAVTPAKGHDILLDALAAVRDLDWHCTCVGALDLDPTFVDRLTDTVRRNGLAERVTFPGPLTRARLEALRSETDLVVSASRRESFGMAVTEGLARGVPVLVTDTGGHPEAVGRAADGSRPGLLVPVGDAGRFAAALRRWLTEPDLRRRLRQAAERRRAGLTTWQQTARAISGTLSDGARLNRTPPALVSPDTTSRTER